MEIIDWELVYRLSVAVSLACTAYLSSNYHKRLKGLEETVEVLEASMVERDKDTLEKRRQGRTMYS